MATRSISGKATLGAFMQDLAIDVRKRLDSRDDGPGYNASGRLQRSVSASVSDELAPTGTLYALSYWRWVGNGRGPGKMPPLDRLRQWALDKGLAQTDSEARSMAYVIAKNIAKDGSYDYQAGGTNVFSDAIQAGQPRVADVLSAFLRDEHNATVSQFNRAFKAA
jgi:hypothetical protein